MYKITPLYYSNLRIKNAKLLFQETKNVAIYAFSLGKLPDLCSRCKRFDKYQQTFQKLISLCLTTILIFFMDTRCAGVAATENCADATLEEVESAIQILQINLFLFFSSSKEIFLFFNRNVLGVAHGDG